MAETPVPETRAEMVGLVAAAREEALDIHLNRQKRLPITELKKLHARHLRISTGNRG